MEIRLVDYGEYDIPFEIAKNLPCYTVDYSMELDEIKQMLIDCMREDLNCDNLDYTNVLVVMEFGNFDIEFCHYYMKEDGSELDTGFYCCAKYSKENNPYNDGWQSEGFSDLETTLDLFESKETLEKAMYESMIGYMKENGFTWSKEN